MHATLLTVLLVTGAQQPSAADQQQLAMATEDCHGTGCNACECWPGCPCWRVARGCLAACCGPMPQTCYAPRFGCYPGNNRHMHRYPASRGYYYRQAYNYRHLFDYPWHATPHEPQGFFTYQGRRVLRQEEQIPTPYPEPETIPPEPLPLAPSPP